MFTKSRYLINFTVGQNFRPLDFKLDYVLFSKTPLYFILVLFNSLR